MPTWSMCTNPMAVLHPRTRLVAPGTPSCRVWGRRDDGAVGGSRRGRQAMNQPSGVHLIVGGYPPGSPAAHDMDYVRLRLLEELAGQDGRHTTVSSDYADLGRWLPSARLLLTYVAGPVPSEDDRAHLRSWLEAGGRWLALHGTSGGKAARVERDGRRGRMMVRQPHHATLGGFFLNHPPVQRSAARGRWATSTTSAPAPLPTWPWATATPPAPTPNRSSTAPWRPTA